MKKLDLSDEIDEENRRELNSDLSVEKYSVKYRIVKTLLMILAWISFGINNEIVGSTLEDLKILLDLNYERVSFGLVVRGIGYLVTICFSGILYDRLSKYAELIMAISANFLIPLTSQYWLLIVWFLIQGLATATYDLGGNHIILKLWHGISSSPINAMHSGYGIGALVAVQIAKPFIKFDPLESLKTGRNSTLFHSNSSFTIKEITSSDIKIMIPYGISAAIGILLVFLFILAQILEIKNSKEFEQKMGHNLVSLKKQANDEDEDNEANKSCFQRLLFDKKEFRGKSLAYMLTQIFLLTVIFFCLQGYITVISKFMLTYLTKGPGNFSVESYSQLQTLYWALFVLARFLAAFLAFKINSILFVFLLLVLNLIVCFLFIIPYFTEIKVFYWIAIVLIGLFSGPMQPSSFMLAKTLLVEYNSFVMSIFLVGSGLGAVFFQQVTGSILDFFQPAENFLGYAQFHPANLIAHAFFAPSIICFLVFIPMFFIYKKYVRLIR